MKKLKFPKLNNSGMSLLEVVVALVFFAVLVAPMMTGFSQSARAQRRATVQTLTTYAAQMKLEEAHGLSYQELADLHIRHRDQGPDAIETAGPVDLTYAFRVSEVAPVYEYDNIEDIARYADLGFWRVSVTVRSPAHNVETTLSAIMHPTGPRIEAPCDNVRVVFVSDSPDGEITYPTTFLVPIGTSFRDNHINFPQWPAPDLWNDRTHTGWSNVTATPATEFTLNTIVTGDTTVEAVWEMLPRVTVTFRPNYPRGADMPRVDDYSISVIVGTTFGNITPPTFPQPANFRFNRWVNEANGQPVPATHRITEDMRILATWTEIQTVTVTFLNGNSTWHVVHLEQGTSVGADRMPASPPTTFHTGAVNHRRVFEHWANDANTSRTFTADYVVNSNMVVRAMFRQETALVITHIANWPASTIALTGYCRFEINEIRTMSHHIGIQPLGTILLRSFWRHGVNQTWGYRTPCGRYELHGWALYPEATEPMNVGTNPMVWDDMRLYAVWRRI